MLALAVYAGMLAYGRLQKSFGPLPWLMAALVAVVTSVLQAEMMGVPLGGPFMLATLMQFAILAILYAAGAGVGRWLDRDKNLD